MALSSIQAMQSRIAAIENTFASMNRVRPQVRAAANAASQMNQAQAVKPTKTATKIDLTAAHQAAPTASGLTFAQLLSNATQTTKQPTSQGVVGEGKWPQVSELVNRWYNTMKVAGAKHGVDPGLLAAIAQVESGGKPDARSHAGAMGLMQFMPATARELGVNPLDPTSAINGAARLMRSHLDKFGSVEKALAAYNAGPGAVIRHAGIPPYQETQNYVHRVTELLRGAS